MKRPTQPDKNLEKSGLASVLIDIRSSTCEVSRKWSACFDWLTVTIAIRQICVYLRENVGEKVGENRGKFYSSPTVCQRVCDCFVPFTHTNMSLPSRFCSGPVSESSKMSTCSVCLFVFNRYFLKKNGPVTR